MGNQFTIEDLAERAFDLGFTQTIGMDYGKAIYHDLVDWLREYHMIDCIAFREFKMPINSWHSIVKHYTHGINRTEMNWPISEKGQLSGGTYYEALNHAIEIGIRILENRKS